MTPGGVCSPRRIAEPHPGADSPDSLSHGPRAVARPCGGKEDKALENDFLSFSFFFLFSKKLKNPVVCKSADPAGGLN